MASSSKQNTNELGLKASSLDAKTEALYTFRTITTMLSYVTRGTAGNRPKIKNKRRNQKELLQLLDALAAVLIRADGVIAVTARPYDGSGKVEVQIGRAHV